MSDLVAASLPQQILSASENSNLYETENTVAETSAGELLRHARETAGVHIAVLAGMLKVPVKKLEALEADRFKELPDAVFVRALASSICRTLKIDPANVLQKLPKNTDLKPNHLAVSINTPFRAPGDSPRPSLWALISRPAVLSGVVLLLGALTIIMLPAVKSSVRNAESNLKTETSSGELPAVAVSVVAPVVIAADAVPSLTSVINTSSGEILTSSRVARSASDPSPIVGPDITVKPPIASAMIDHLAPLLALPAASASGAVTLPSTSIVEFNAKVASWVEVTDAKGQVVLRRTLIAGETVTASGVFPLTAIVGRADTTEVKIRGKGFDLRSFTKDNVARFEVK